MNRSLPQTLAELDKLAALYHACRCYRACRWWQWRSRRNLRAMIEGLLADLRQQKGGAS